MNVAEQPRKSGFVESNGLHGALRVHPEIEFLAVTKRKDVMKHLVVVWKLDRRADLDDKDTRDERQVALVEHNLLLCRSRSAAGRLEPDDRMLRRPAGDLNGSGQFGAKRWHCGQAHKGTGGPDNANETPHG